MKYQKHRAIFWVTAVVLPLCRVGRMDYWLQDFQDKRSGVLTKTLLAYEVFGGALHSPGVSSFP